jgi:hypothetical protein
MAIGGSLHPANEEAYDASDPKQVEKKRLAKARWEKDSREVLAQLMSSPNGRRWMWEEILSPAGIYSISYVTGDAMGTAFNEGKRNIGNRTLALIIKTCPQEYLLMQQEAGERE